MRVSVCVLSVPSWQPRAPHSHSPSLWHRDRHTGERSVTAPQPGQPPSPRQARAGPPGTGRGLAGSWWGPEHLGAGWLQSKAPGDLPNPSGGLSRLRTGQRVSLGPGFPPPHSSLTPPPWAETHLPGSFTGLVTQSWPESPTLTPRCWDRVIPEGLCGDLHLPGCLGLGPAGSGLGPKLGRDRKSVV